MKRVYTFLIFIILLLSQLSLLYAQNEDLQELGQQAGIDKISKALTIITGFYVDSVDTDKLVTSAIKGMLKELDPHSVYFNADEIKRANDRLLGNFTGIGIHYEMIEDTIVVLHPLPYGPSAMAGVLAGDRLISINGNKATGNHANTAWISKKLRGEAGTVVTMEFLRPGESKLITLEIERAKIPINSLDAGFMLSEKTGYIKLNKFSRTTMAEFNKSFDALEKSGMRNLILDLRGNSGGYLDVANKLTDVFLKKKLLMVYTEGINSKKKEYFSTRKGKFEKGSLVILIDERSASASEIVAGAIQDWDRGLVIGRRSFGKGMVQKPYTLPDGSVIRLTVARYYTPTGRLIQRPYDKGKEAYYDEIRKRTTNNTNEHIDSISIPDSLKFYTPNHRMVIGGGGIVPDVIVPPDTTAINELYKNIRNANLINRFILQQVDKKRDSLLQQYPDTDAFIQKYPTQPTGFDQFIAYCKQKQLEIDEDQLSIIKNRLERALKRSYARHLYDYSSVFRVIATDDETIQKALELIEEKNIAKRYNLKM
ncbi:MAG: S41 family peptidase [Bacteroidales bacterium]|nr:S41 family peptidase [Bacteroidales bacterium]